MQQPQRPGGAGQPLAAATAPADSGQSGGSASELPDDFFADLDAWYAASDGAVIDPLPVTPPLASPDASADDHSSDSASAPNPTTSLRARPRSSRRSLLKPKHSTQRQKEELLYLRGKTAELEERLRALKRSCESDEGVEEAQNGTGECGGSWRAVAKRQRQEKDKVVEENAALLKMLQGQIKLARSLERLLGKQEVWDQLQHGHWRTSDLEGQDDTQVLANLEQRVNARVPMLKGVLQSLGLDGVMQDMDDIKLTHTPADGIVLQNRHAKLFPFDSHIAEETIWQSLREGRVKLGNEHIIVMKQSPDVVLTKIIIHEPPITRKPATMYHAMRRFPDVNCSCIVWEFMALTDGDAAAGYPPLQVNLRGWGRIQPTSLRDGSAATVFHEVSTVTLTVLSPSSSSEATEEPRAHREISILTGYIKSLFQQKRASMRQCLENLVLDASVAASRA